MHKYKNLKDALNSSPIISKTKDKFNSENAFANPVDIMRKRCKVIN